MPVQPPAESGDAVTRSPEHRRAGQGREATEGHRLLLPRRERDGHCPGLHQPVCDGRLVFC